MWLKLVGPGEKDRNRWLLSEHFISVLTPLSLQKGHGLVQVPVERQQRMSRKAGGILPQFQQLCFHGNIFPHPRLEVQQRQT